MKKDVVIIRFGLPAPTKGDVAFIGKILSSSENFGDFDALTGNFRIGIASILTTNLTPSELRIMLNEAEIETGDNLPTIIFYRDNKDINLTLKGGDAVQLKNLFRKFDENLGRDAKAEEKETIVLNMDFVLDKISEKGMESLTKKELEFLKESSK